MADSNSAPSCSFMLLQPELLSEEALIEILTSRCVSMETLQGMTKEKLIDLYMRVALPLPQREKRKGESMKRKSISPPRDTKGSGFTIGFNGSIKTSVSTSSSRSTIASPVNDRLKPPPEIQNKKIRLSNSKSNSLDNIVINNRRKSADSEQKTGLVNSVDTQLPVEKNGTDEEKRTSTDVKKILVEPKRVTLKRDFKQQVSDDTNRADESSQKKKQRAKITWP